MSGKNFILHQTTSLQREIQNTKAVECACARFKRDMEMTLEASAREGGTVILRQKKLEPEAYEMEVSEDTVVIYGSNDRSFIYALNELSEKYLGILPFGFWNDQEIKVKPYV